MKRIAVFPGSFDPVTKGHEDIILRGCEIFDELVVAIGINSSKKYMFDLEKRELWLNQIFKDHDKVSVRSFEGLTVDFCESVGSKFILRGFRNTIDFEYEKSIAQMNRTMNDKIETVVLFSDPSLAAINSSIVREIIKNKGNVARFVPEGIDVYA